MKCILRDVNYQNQVLKWNRGNTIPHGTKLKMKYYYNIFSTRAYTDISPRGDISLSKFVPLGNEEKWGIFFSPLGKNGE